MLVDDVNIHVKGWINEVEEMREHIRAKLEDEVGLLQLKMSGTEKEKEGKTNMFLSNKILGVQVSKSWSQEERIGITQFALHRSAEFEARGACHKWEWCS